MKNREEHIVRLLRANDKEAISLIYDHYAPALYGVVLRMVGDEETAQDVLQESLVKCWKNATSYNPSKAKLFTWLLNITRNTAIDKIRSRKSRLEKIQNVTAHVSDNGYQAIRPDTMDVKDQVSKMEPKLREVLDALFFRGMTQQEASKELNIPLGTVKTRLRNALKKLKTVYGEQHLPFLLLLCTALV